MVTEAKNEKVEPKVCEFTGYLRQDGKLIIKAESDECRKAIVAAGEVMGVDVELEKPAVECEPCKEAAMRFLAAMQAKKDAALAEPPAEPPAPVTES